MNFPAPSSSAPSAISPRFRLAGLAALVIGAGLYLAFPVWRAAGARHDNDFKHIYAGAWLVARGLSPYDRAQLFIAAEEAILPPGERGLGRLALNPFVYPPFTGFALGPLTALRFDAAAAAWFWISHACMLLAAAALLRALRFGPGAVLLGAGVAALLLGWNFPLYRNQTAGQLNAPLLLLLAAALGALLRESEAAQRASEGDGGGDASGAGGLARWLKRPGSWAAIAGFALAFGAWFKISPGLFLFFLLFKRRWRALRWMLIFTLAIGGVTLLAAGTKMHREFLPLLRQMRYGHSTWEDITDARGEPRVTFYRDPGNQSLNALMHHLVAGGGGYEPVMILGPRAADALTVFGTIILLWLGVMPLRRSNREAIEREVATIERGTGGEIPPAPDAAIEPPERTVLDFGLFLMLSLFVPSLMWDHYLVQAVLAALGLAWVLWRRREARPWAAAAGLAAAWAIIGLPQQYAAPLYMSGAGLLLGHAKFFAALLLFALLLDARRHWFTPREEPLALPEEQK